MATTSYTDIGAMQRIESGSPTAKTAYVDMGAVQRQEQVVISNYVALERDIRGLTRGVATGSRGNH